MNMTCAECRELLIDLTYGELDAARAAEVELHLAGCAECRAERERLAQTRAAFAPLFSLEARSGSAGSSRLATPLLRPTTAALEEPGPAFDLPILAAAREVASATLAKSGPRADGPAAADTSAGAVVIPFSGHGPNSVARRLAPRSRWMRAALLGSVAAAAALALVVSVGRGPERFDAPPRAAEGQSAIAHFTPPPPNARGVASGASPVAPKGASPAQARLEPAPADRASAEPRAPESAQEKGPQVAFAPPPPEQVAEKFPEQETSRAARKKSANVSALGSEAALDKVADGELDEKDDGRSDRVGGLGGLADATAGAGAAQAGRRASSMHAGAGLLGAAAAASGQARPPAPTEAALGPAQQQAPAPAAVAARPMQTPAGDALAQPRPVSESAPAASAPPAPAPAPAFNVEASNGVAEQVDAPPPAALASAPRPSAAPGKHLAAATTPAQLEAQAAAARSAGRIEKAARLAAAAARQRIGASDPSQIERAARDLVDAISAYAQLGRLAEARSLRAQLAALSPAQPAAIADADAAIAAPAASVPAASVPAASVPAAPAPASSSDRAGSTASPAPDGH